MPKEQKEFNKRERRKYPDENLRKAVTDMLKREKSTYGAHIAYGVPERTLTRNYK